MSFKYTVLPTLLPGLGSGLVLFGFDTLLSKSSLMQSANDALVLGASEIGGQLMAKFAYKMVDQLWPSLSDMDTVRNYVVTPALVAYLYRWLYNSSILDEFGVNVRSIRSQTQNMLLAYGCSIGGQVVTSNLLSMLF